MEEMKNRSNVEWLFAFLQEYQDDSEKGWMARLDAADALAALPSTLQLAPDGAGKRHLDDRSRGD